MEHKFCILVTLPRTKSHASKLFSEFCSPTSKLKILSFTLSIRYNKKNYLSKATLSASNMGCVLFKKNRDSLKNGNSITQSIVKICFTIKLHLSFAPAQTRSGSIVLHKESLTSYLKTCEIEALLFFLLTKFQGARC